MPSSNILFNSILKDILVFIMRFKGEKENFSTKMLENAVTTLGTIEKKPQSITSEKTKQLWS